MKKIKFLFFGILLMIGNKSMSQNTSPYELKKSLDIPLVVLGSAGIVSDFFWTKNMPALTESQIQNLDRQDVFSLDRGIINNWSPKAAKASDFAMYGSGLAPLIMLADKRMRKDAFKIGLLYYETIAVNVAVTNLTKSLFKRTRPFVYGNQASLEKKMEIDSRKSFFSGHSSFSAATCFFTAKVFSDYYPNSKYKTLVWVMAATVPAFTASMRCVAGKHFISDVIVGYAVGATIGFLIPHFHKSDSQIEIGQEVNQQNIPLIHLVFRF